MSPAIYNMPDHYKGDTFDEITFTIKEDTVAVDLTGAVIKMDFRKNTNTGTLKQSFIIGSGLTVVNAVGGVFKLDSFINDWDTDTYFYDAEITFADGIIRTYFKGSLSVNQDI
tara:strand:- start:37 stop:375 length:339 start_codon:yes stop_codon:yes gene_type:complete